MSSQIILEVPLPVLEIPVTAYAVFGTVIQSVYLGHVLSTVYTGVLVTSIYRGRVIEE